MVNLKDIPGLFWRLLARPAPPRACWSSRHWPEPKSPCPILVREITLRMQPPASTKDSGFAPLSNDSVPAHCGSETAVASKGAVTPTYDDRKAAPVATVKIRAHPALATGFGRNPEHLGQPSSPLGLPRHMGSPVQVSYR